VISVRFSCDGCGLKDEIVQVPARKSEENVVAWMHASVATAYTFHHSVVSPHCTSKNMSNLKIPIDTADPDAWIGKQTDLIPPETSSSGRPPEEQT
jgi:hypothetical protein